MTVRNLILGESPVGIEDVLAVARGQARVSLSEDAFFLKRLARGHEVLAEKWQQNQVVYGVTTGVGESCVRRIPAELVPQFSRNLARFHGCGLGRIFEPSESAAILLVRLASLTRGYSAVRPLLLERLTAMLNQGILPLIPAEGSVGASGDLTPLSYIAAVLMGERQVFYQGQVCDASKALAAADIEPVVLEPKEGLAIMNGTSVMTALACIAYDRADYLARMSARITAMASEALLGNKAHFDPRIFAQKPHPGQAAIADWIAKDLGYNQAYQHSENSRIQDTYALRCAPHIIGVLSDALPWMKVQIETEINSANDNPLIDPNNGDTLHGGNFYGGHIAFAMDGLKTLVANIADLLDRQIALLVDVNRNKGLPSCLSGADASLLPVNHGFKAVQIGCSAWAAEALKLTMPASVFSRSTESHNQDKVSMGTIAARDCLRVLELTEQVMISTLAACVQAIELRIKAGQLSLADLSEGIRGLFDQVRHISPFVEEDRPLEAELRALHVAVLEQSLACPGQPS